MQLQIIVLALAVVGLLLYQVVYSSKLKEPQKRLIGIVAIIVVVLWLASQIFIYFINQGVKP